MIGIAAREPQKVYRKRQIGKNDNLYSSCLVHLTCFCSAAGFVISNRGCLKRSYFKHLGKNTEKRRECFVQFQIISIGFKPQVAI